jgi:hypothetical protein
LLAQAVPSSPSAMACTWWLGGVARSVRHGPAAEVPCDSDGGPTIFPTNAKARKPNPKVMLFSVRVQDREIFLVGPAHHDPERIIRQWPLCLRLIPWGARIQTSHSSLVVDHPAGKGVVNTSLRILLLRPATCLRDLRRQFAVRGIHRAKPPLQYRPFRQSG